jgi:hypothetical protein
LRGHLEHISHPTSSLARASLARELRGVNVQEERNVHLERLPQSIVDRVQGLGRGRVSRSSHAGFH